MNKLVVCETIPEGTQGFQGQLIYPAHLRQIDELDPAEWHLILQLRQIKTPSYVTVEIGGDGKPKAIGEIVESKRQALAKDLPPELKPVM